MTQKLGPGAGGTEARKNKRTEQTLPYTKRHHSSTHYVATLVGNDVATAFGLRAQGPTPVLKLCRLLLRTGFDPDRPLHAYRGATLCLVIRSIGAAAELNINSKGTSFIRRRAVRPAPPMRQIRLAAS